MLERFSFVFHWAWYAPEHGEEADGLLELSTDDLADLLNGHCILLDGGESRYQLMVRLYESSLDGSGREVVTHEERPTDVEPTEREWQRSPLHLVEGKHWRALQMREFEWAERLEARAHSMGLHDVGRRLFRRRALEVELLTGQGGE